MTSFRQGEDLAFRIARDPNLQDKARVGDEEPLAPIVIGTVDASGPPVPPVPPETPVAPVKPPTGRELILAAVERIGDQIPAEALAVYLAGMALAIQFPGPVLSWVWWVGVSLIAIGIGALTTWWGTPRISKRFGPVKRKALQRALALLIAKVTALSIVYFIATPGTPLASVDTRIPLVAGFAALIVTTVLGITAKKR